MFIMDYEEGKGWHDGRIVPMHLFLDPAAVVFPSLCAGNVEGLKAYKTKEGKVQLFRPDMNAKRTNRTNDRLCIPRSMKPCKGGSD